MQVRLYRSEADRMLGGVCAGLGAYLGIDPTLVRIFFVLFALANGIGVFLYLLLWVVLPVEEAPERDFEERLEQTAQEIAGRASELGKDFTVSGRARDPRTVKWIGGVMVFLGGYFLLKSFNFPWMDWLDFSLLWTLAMIAGGVALLVRGERVSDA